MDPETGNASRRSGDGNSFRQVVPMVPDADIEEAIQNWGDLRGSHRSASQNRRKSGQNLGRFGSQSSVSVLDVIAAGGQIEMLPFYDIFVKNLTYKVFAPNPPQPRLLPFSPNSSAMLSCCNVFDVWAFQVEIFNVMGFLWSGQREN